MTTNIPQLETILVRRLLDDLFDGDEEYRAQIIESVHDALRQADHLDEIRGELELGERDGRAAGARTAAELFDGPESESAAVRCLADLAVGNPDLWLQCPEPHHMHGDSYLDGYGAGWAAELERQARLVLMVAPGVDPVLH